MHFEEGKTPLFCREEWAALSPPKKHPESIKYVVRVPGDVRGGLLEGGTGRGSVKKSFL